MADSVMATDLGSGVSFPVSGFPTAVHPAYAFVTRAICGDEEEVSLRSSSDPIPRR